MGGAVSISPVACPSASQFNALLEDAEALKRLYDVISVFGLKEGKINLKNKISLTEMLLYIETGNNPIFNEAFPNCPAVVIKTAYEFSVSGKKGNHEMNKKEFHKFLPIVYLFYHLWRIFDIADSSIEDRRIFPNEFLLVKYTIESIPGVHLAAVTREEWEAEFTVLDKNKDGYVSFRELCKYVISKIVTPQKYLEALKQLEASPSVEYVASPLDGNQQEGGGQGDGGEEEGQQQPEGEQEQRSDGGEVEEGEAPGPISEESPLPTAVQTHQTVPATNASSSLPPSSPPPPQPAPALLNSALQSLLPQGDNSLEDPTPLSAQRGNANTSSAPNLSQPSAPLPSQLPTAAQSSSPRKISPRVDQTSSGGGLVASSSAVL
jgi:hypothetical protein